MDPVSALQVLAWAIGAVTKGCEIYNRIKSASEKLGKLERQIQNRLGHLEDIRRTLLPKVNLEWEQHKRVQRHIEMIVEAGSEAADILNLWNSSSTQQSRIQKGLFRVGLNCGRLEALASDIKTNVEDITAEFDLPFKATSLKHNDTATAPGTYPSGPTGILPDAGLQPTTLPAPCHSQNTQTFPHNQQQHPSLPGLQPQPGVSGLPNGFGSVPGNSGKPGMVMCGSGLPSTGLPAVPNTSFGQPQPHNPSAYAPLNNVQPNYQSFAPPRPPVIPSSFPHPGAAFSHQQSSASQNTPSQVHHPPHAGPRPIQPYLSAYPQPSAPTGFVAPRQLPPRNGPKSFPLSGNPTGFAAAQPAPAMRMPQSSTQAPPNFTAPQPPAGQIPQGTFHHSAGMPSQPQLHQYQPPPPLPPQAQTRLYQTPTQPAPPPQAPRWNGAVPTPPGQPSNHLPQHGFTGIPQHRTGPPSCPAPGMGNMANQTPHAQTVNHNLAHHATADGVPAPRIPYANSGPFGVGQHPHPVPTNRFPQPGPARIAQDNSGPAHVSGGMPNAPSTAIRPPDTSREQETPAAEGPEVEMLIERPGISISLKEGVMRLKIT